MLVVLLWRMILAISVVVVNGAVLEKETELGSHYYEDDIPIDGDINWNQFSKHLERRHVVDPSMLASFGVVTDIHYADVEKSDGNRDVNLSAEKLLSAIELFNHVKPGFLFMNGDAKEYDHDAKEHGFTDEGDSAIRFLRQIEGVLQRFNGPVFHTVGNHDIDVLTKKEYFDNIHNHKMGANAEKRFYSFNQGPIHFVVIDSNFHIDGQDMWSIYESNGLFKQDKVLVSDQVLEWLRADLDRHADMNVVVFSHHRLDIGRPEHSPMNADIVRSILESHGGVLCVIQGHDHGLKKNLQRINGIGYYLLRPMVLHRGAFAVVEIDAECNVLVSGYNSALSVEFRLDVNRTAFCNPDAQPPIGDLNIEGGIEDTSEREWSLPPKPSSTFEPSLFLPLTNLSTTILISELVHKASLYETPLKNDWIELCCVADMPIDISGYILINTMATIPFVFSEGTVIEAQECRLLPRYERGSFKFGINKVDSLRLFDADGNLVDATVWGHVDNVVNVWQSWARVCDKEGYLNSSFIATYDQSPGMPNAGCQHYTGSGIFPPILSSALLPNSVSLTRTRTSSHNIYPTKTSHQSGSSFDTIHPTETSHQSGSSFDNIYSTKTSHLSWSSFDNIHPTETSHQSGSSFDNIYSTKTSHLSWSSFDNIYSTETSHQSGSSFDNIYSTKTSHLSWSSFDNIYPTETSHQSGSSFDNIHPTKTYSLSSVTPFPTPSSPLVPPFRIMSKDGKQCLTHNGYFVRARSCDDTRLEDQWWEATSIGMLRNPTTGRCMDVRATQGKNWGEIRTYLCRGLPEQLWEFTTDGRLISLRDNMCTLLASDNSLRIYNCNRSRDTALWQLRDYNDTIMLHMIYMLPRYLYYIHETSLYCAQGSYFVTGNKLCNPLSKWEFTSEGHIIRSSDGRCMNVRDSRDKNWASLNIVSCRGVPRQFFYYDQVAGTLRSSWDHRCIIISSDGRLKTHSDCTRSPLWLWSDPDILIK